MNDAEYKSSKRQNFPRNMNYVRYKGRDGGNRNFKGKHGKYNKGIGKSKRYNEKKNNGNNEERNNNVGD